MGKLNLSNSLKVNGLKSTKHRINILGILEKSKQPITAKQIFKEMYTNDMSINLSTIYRVLEVLCEKKLITKLNFEGDNRALFEFNSKLHKHHLICLGCKKISVIYSCPLEGYEKTLEKETGYTILGHKLDVYGYCPKCRKKKEK